jgi:hypothetical protein
MVYFKIVVREGIDEALCGSVPKLNCSIIRSGGDKSSVWRELGRFDPV